MMPFQKVMPLMLCGPEAGSAALIIMSIVGLDDVYVGPGAAGVIVVDHEAMDRIVDKAAWIHLPRTNPWANHFDGDPQDAVCENRYEGCYDQPVGQVTIVPEQ